MKHNDDTPEGFAPIPDRRVVGYWIPESGPIQGVYLEPREYVRHDGSMARYHMFRLTAQVAVVGKADGGLEQFLAEPDELVGVWHAGDLGRLQDHAGKELHISRTAKRDIGQGRSMWTFQILERVAPGTSSAQARNVQTARAQPRNVQTTARAQSRNTQARPPARNTQRARVEPEPEPEPEPDMF